MCQRLQTIDKFYNNLQYNESKREDILKEISALPKTIKIKDVNDISERFLETASIIEKNLSLFQSVCQHVDIVTTIIEYLTNFGVKLSFCNNFEEEYKREDIMYTLAHICGDNQLNLFLENAIFQTYDEGFQYRWKYIKCYEFIKNPFNEMILLEDSDLYAVISYLRIIYSKQGHLFSFNKIWVQEFIKEKFLWLVKEYFENLTLPICVFQSRKELFTNHENKMKIVSIWSEDIIAAKNLASSLNKEVLFINTHMDLCGGIISIPYIKLFDETLDTEKYKLHNFNMNNYVNKLEILKPEIPIYNLFYYGKWQQPVENTYWMYKETLWAHATSCDIKRCIDSAKEGFKIWSTKSITSRNQILFKFASILKCDGKFVLADKILKWIKFSNIYETSLLCSQSERSEITKIRKPRGIIILKEKDESILFDRLTQILIAGNCVIVIYDGKDSYSIAQYCDKISVSEIPSGVINLLSNDNFNTLQFSLCIIDYDSYAERFFSRDNPEKTYINLTVPKYIILPIK